MFTETNRLRWLTLGLLLGSVLASIDQTIVASAMPNVVKGWEGLSLYGWVFSAYMLASTVTMPIYGKLADLYGRKKTYAAGMLLFLAGSTLCGMAGNMPEFILYRALQGLGAGALLPVTFTMIADVFPPERRGTFMGWFGAVFAVSSTAGPALGGWLAEYGDWRWIFWINLPLGAAALLLIGGCLQENAARDAGKPSVDWLGALALTGSVASFLLSLVLGGSAYAWSSPPVLGLIAAGVCLLGALIWIEARAKDPMVPLRLFRIRSIAYGNLAGFFVSAGMFGAIAFIPLFAQGVLGMSASAAGTLLIALMLSASVTSMACGRWMTRVSFRGILVPSLGAMLIGFLLLSRMDANTGAAVMILYLILTGLGMGSVYPALGTAAQNAVEWRERGAATAGSQFFRSIGGTLGVSVLGSLLSARISAGAGGYGAGAGENELQRLLLDPVIRASLPEEVLGGLQTAFSDALSGVFLAGALFVGIGLIASVLMGNARMERAVKGESMRGSGGNERVTDAMKGEIG
ncbi:MULTISPECIES: MDR family MFS transporter [Paenibacillus]|uniref:MDR family MFS transporter n=1 Tax=Paenibacillus TaxID=44249 RepID=UPI0022B8DD11|nr:MDR family MFS transporter [Paenibacillus caseinilyticus]MCZ8521938.1 MDR family MFS transporter [Paenibacillus caseinilyticus]